MHRMNSKYKRLNRPYDIESHTALVKSIAQSVMSRQYLPAYIGLEDLIQEGMFGLLDAFENYDENNGASLETFARIKIRGAILDHIRSQSFRPRQLTREIKQFSEISHIFFQDQGREPTRQELSELTGMPLEKVEYILTGMNFGEVRDIDEDNPLFDRFAHPLENNPESVILDINMSEVTVRLLESLPRRDQEVMSLYYIEGLTQEEIGKVMNLTPARVSQLLSEAKKALAAQLDGA